MDDATRQQIIHDGQKKADALNAYSQINKRLDEIIDELNDIERDIEYAGEYIIDVVIDMREDEGLPPFSPEELAAATAECDRIGDKVQALEDRQRELMQEYFDLVGCAPHYYGLTARFARSWHERRRD